VLIYALTPTRVLGDCGHLPGFVSELDHGKPVTLLVSAAIRGDDNGTAPTS
jgi:hypothetical protein